MGGLACTVHAVTLQVVIKINMILWLSPPVHARANVQSGVESFLPAWQAGRVEREQPRLSGSSSSFSSPSPSSSSPSPCSTSARPSTVASCGSSQGDAGRPLAHLGTPHPRRRSYVEQAQTLSSIRGASRSRATLSTIIWYRARGSRGPAVLLQPRLASSPSAVCTVCTVCTICTTAAGVVPFRSTRKPALISGLATLDSDCVGIGAAGGGCRAAKTRLEKLRAASMADLGALALGPIQLCLFRKRPASAAVQSARPMVLRVMQYFVCMVRRDDLLHGACCGTGCGTGCGSASVAPLRHRWPSLQRGINPGVDLHTKCVLVALE